RPAGFVHAQREQSAHAGPRDRPCHRGAGGGGRAGDLGQSTPARRRLAPHGYGAHGDGSGHLGDRRPGTLPRRAQPLRRGRQHDRDLRGSESHLDDPGGGALHRRRDDPETGMTRPALAAQRDLLVVVLDTLVPADAAFRAAGATALASLSVDGREAVLRRVEQSHAAFFEALVGHTYDGYYSHPTVIARLGLDPSPLHPRGHRVETVDAPDLARVAARGPLYRRA